MVRLSGGDPGRRKAVGRAEGNSGLRRHRLTPRPVRARVGAQNHFQGALKPMRAILAYLTAKPGMEAEFQKQMTAQAKRCLDNEPGCLQFDVVQDPKNPTRFVMLEVYQDDAAIKAHQ